MNESFFALPQGRDTPLRTTFTEQIEYEHIAVLQILNHVILWILVPCLYYPNGFGIDTLHGFHDNLSGCIIINLANHLAFMERIHGVIVGFSEQGFLFLIISSGHLFETRVEWLENGRTGKTIPRRRFSDVETHFLVGIVRNHTGITW